MSSSTASRHADNTDTLLREISELVVSTLNLEISADQLDPDMIIFGDEGLGLDSIDALEIALIIEHKYGIKFEAEDDENHNRFTNIRALTEFVASERTR